jgi:phosphoribosyl 1,2-cyclic phosphodiesterase
VTLRFASLGSGSSGNALVVEAGASRVMLDCGFNLGETTARLARSGLVPGDLAGILVTHEHTDHLGGVARFAKRHALPVFLTRGTAQSLGADFPAVPPGTMIPFGETGADAWVSALTVIAR